MSVMREQLIEAAARAMVGHFTPVTELSDLPKDRTAMRAHHRAGGDLTDTQEDMLEAATAALDAILAKLSAMKLEMRDDGGLVHELRGEPNAVFQAMLQPLKAADVR